MIVARVHTIKISNDGWMFTMYIFTQAWFLNSVRMMKPLTWAHNNFLIGQNIFYHQTRESHYDFVFWCDNKAIKRKKDNIFLRSCNTMNF